MMNINIMEQCSIDEASGDQKSTHQSYKEAREPKEHATRLLRKIWNQVFANRKFGAHRSLSPGVFNNSSTNTLSLAGKKLQIIDYGSLIDNKSPWKNLEHQTPKNNLGGGKSQKIANNQFTEFPTINSPSEINLKIKEQTEFDKLVTNTRDFRIMD